MSENDVTSEPERVTLQFLCVHDRGAVNLEKVDSRQRLREYAVEQGWTLREDRELSWMAHLAYNYNATLSYDVDQWFRAIATVDHYDVEQKTVVEELVVTVECDLLEDGFAELCLWLAANRQEDE